MIKTLKKKSLYILLINFMLFEIINVQHFFLQQLSQHQSYQKLTSISDCNNFWIWPERNITSHKYLSIWWSQKEEENYYIICIIFIFYLDVRPVSPFLDGIEEFQRQLKARAKRLLDACRMVINPDLSSPT